MSRDIRVMADNDPADQNRFVITEEQWTEWMDRLQREPRFIPEIAALFAEKSLLDED